MQAWLGKRIYYGWVVVGITALTLLVASGVRAASVFSSNHSKVTSAGAGRRFPLRYQSALCSTASPDRSVVL